MAAQREPAARSALSTEPPVLVERLRLWQGTVETQVDVRGGGPPLVYLHGPWGASADGQFLDLLAQDWTVYAPWHPGTTPGDSEAIHRIDDWWDLLLYYGELLDHLALSSVALVGHSFGGMVASELAAAMPHRVGKLALISPLGLWRDDLPVKNWMIISDADRRKALFAEPEGEAAQRFFSLPDDRQARAEAQASFIWSQACTGKFVWPIPDKGLKKHIHRIGAPTLIIWGTQDGVISPAYAREFASRIADSRVELLEGAGHMPHLEQPEIVADLVRALLGD